MVVPSENKFTGELLSVGHVKINKSKPKTNLHQNTLSKTYELNELVMVDYFECLENVKECVNI